MHLKSNMFAYKKSLLYDVNDDNGMKRIKMKNFLAYGIYNMYINHANQMIRSIECGNRVKRRSSRDWEKERERERKMKQLMLVSIFSCHNNNISQLIASVSLSIHISWPPFNPQSSKHQSTLTNVYFISNLDYK